MYEHFIIRQLHNCKLIPRSLPEIDGLSKETVLTTWLAKLDCIMKGTGKNYLIDLNLNRLKKEKGVIKANWLKALIIFISMLFEMISYYLVYC